MIGITANRRATPVVSATPDYGDGDCIGPLITFNNFAAIEKGSGLLTSLVIKSLAAISVDVIVHIFDANPSASTFTDNAAISIHADDKTKLLRSVNVAAADFSQLATGVYQATADLRIPYELASGRSLYMALESTGAVNLASTSDIEVMLAAENNN